MISEVDLSVIVVNYNTGHLIAPMMAALDEATKGLTRQVIVIDNASRDDSVALMRQQHPEVHLIVNTANVGFGRANNQALPFLKGRAVLLLNTDAFVAPEAITTSLKVLASRPDVGVLGARLVGRDGELQPSCRYFPTPWNVFLSKTGLQRFFPGTRSVDDMAWDHRGNRECDWVPGCYYLMPRAVVDQVGLFDPRYFLYYEEVDHCKAVKAAGWQILYNGDTSVIHIGGESAKSDAALTSSGRQISVLQVESELIYFRKHHGLGGLILHLALVFVGDCYLALKAIAKRQGVGAALAAWHQTAQVRSLLLKTHMGQSPTR